MSQTDAVYPFYELLKPLQDEIRFLRLWQGQAVEYLKLIATNKAAPEHLFRLIQQAETTDYPKGADG